MRRHIISGFAVAVATFVTPAFVTAAIATSASATTRAAASLLIADRSNFGARPVLITPHTFVRDKQQLVRLGGLTVSVTKAVLNPANQDVEKALGALELATA